MSQHAVLAPSGAETWMACAGSAAMQKGLPDDGNEYSDEGTAAHLLASTCLEKHFTPRAYEGKLILVGRNDRGFDGAIWCETKNPGDTVIYPDSSVFRVRRSYVVDDEMIEHVGKYVDRIRQYAAGAHLMVPERRVAIGFLTGEKDAHGTSDAAIVLPGELQTHDLKYGMGVRVSAKRNKQLMIYALANREELEMAYGPFERFRFVIHQPRLGDVPDEWDCTAAELDAFALEVRSKAELALELHRQRSSWEGVQSIVPLESLSASDDACRWCKAKPSCPELAKKLTNTFADEFQALASGVPAAELRFEKMTLGEKMAAIPLIEDWCKAVRAELERQIFAGTQIPGWKVVQGKRGNRQWNDLEAAEKLLKTMRMSIEERYKMELKTPPAIEKALKSEPRRWKRVLDAGLIEQRDGQPSVAPESDPRPVWTPPDTSNDFTATEEPIA